NLFPGLEAECIEFLRGDVRQFANGWPQRSPCHLGILQIKHSYLLTPCTTGHFHGHLHNFYAPNVGQVTSNPTCHVSVNSTETETFLEEFAPSLQGRPVAFEHTIALEQLDPSSWLGDAVNLLHDPWPLHRRDAENQ